MSGLSINLAGVELENPTILASGILGSSASTLSRVWKAGAGAVTTKSIGPRKRDGHNNPVVYEIEGGLLNAVGLPTPGPEGGIQEIKEFKKSKSKSKIIASIYASRIREYPLLAEKIASAKPDIIELNISCPNVEDEFGVPFSHDKKTATKITRNVKNRIRKYNIPLFVKLSPNVLDIGEIAREVEKAGADGITAINSVGPGMAIDINARKPVLSNKSGGISGPLIKPIAVKCVYEIYEKVNVPIIGIGGIVSGADVIEMMMAGASAVGIATGVMYDDIAIFGKIKTEINKFLKAEKITRIDEIVGVAH